MSHCADRALLDGSAISPGRRLGVQDGKLIADTVEFSLVASVILALGRTGSMSIILAVMFSM